MPTTADNELKGRLALITGASGGLGAACAKDLYAQGCHLALTYTSSKAKVDALVEDLKTSPHYDSERSVTTYKVDVSSASDIEALFRDLKDRTGHDGPDILVSNAGTPGLPGKGVPLLKDITVENFDYTLTVNLRASFLLSKLAVPPMQARGWGRVVFVSSIAAIGGGINGCHYAASKAGLTGMMKNLAYKHAAEGITFNDVAPAMIGETGMIPDAKRVEGTPGDVKNIPVGRLGVPQECANVVTMLCKTGYMTGQSILLSGGLK